MNRPRPKVLVTCPIEHATEAIAILEEVCELTWAPEVSREELIEQIGGQDAIFTNIKQRIDRGVIDAADSLRLISTPSTGTDHIDLEYAASKQIVVHSLKVDEAFLRSIPSTAEHAFLLMLAVLRHLPAACSSVRDGRWARDDFRGHEAHGRTVGVIGFGRLGRMFSAFAQAFGMKVVASDPYVTVDDPAVKQVSLSELYRTADIVSLHLHLDATTRGLIDRRAFDQMRDGVYLINTSRGAIIEESALLEALQSGKVKAAGLDVLAEELDSPISDIPLVQYAKNHDNLLITPHLGGCTLDAQAKAYARMAGRMVAFMARGEQTEPEKV